METCIRHPAGCGDVGRLDPNDVQMADRSRLDMDTRWSARLLHEYSTSHLADFRETRPVAKNRRGPTSFFMRLFSHYRARRQWYRVFLQRGGGFKALLMSMHHLLYGSVATISRIHPVFRKPNVVGSPPDLSSAIELNAAGCNAVPATCMDASGSSTTRRMAHRESPIHGAPQTVRRIGGTGRGPSNEPDWRTSIERSKTAIRFAKLEDTDRHRQRDGRDRPHARRAVHSNDGFVWKTPYPRSNLHLTVGLCGLTRDGANSLLPTKCPSGVTFRGVQ